MGIFSFLSSNYKAKDFIGKTPKQVIDEMKMDKLSSDILADEEYNTLPEETRNAIQMMIDLKKGKIEVFEKCYNKRRASVRPMAGVASARPMAGVASPRPIARVASPRPMAGVASARPAPITHAGPFKIPEQQGGRKRKRTNKKLKRAVKTRKNKRKGTRRA
jgi:hypothetical protein